MSNSVVFLLFFFFLFFLVKIRNMFNMHYGGYNIVMLSSLGKVFCRRHIEVFLFLFLENRN